MSKDFFLAKSVLRNPYKTVRLSALQLICHEWLIGFRSGQKMTSDTLQLPSKPVLASGISTCYNAPHVHEIQKLFPRSETEFGLFRLHAVRCGLRQRRDH